MDDRKEQENGVQPENEAQALHDELETLAKVFQEELNRAKAEAQDVAENGVPDPEILIQELEELPADAHTSSVSEEVVPQDELCECCGEKRRGTQKYPHSPYCEDCDEGLRRYPFEWLHVVLALVALCVVFFGGYVFANHTDAFVAAAKADKYAREHKLESALEAYVNATDVMKNAGISGELVYNRTLLTLYRLGYVNVLDEFTGEMRPWEFRLPHFYKTKKIVDTSEAMMLTADAASKLVMPYETTPARDIPYDEVLAKLEELKTTEVPVTDTTDEAQEGTSKASASVYQPKVKSYDAAMVSFYQYYLALLCEKDMETQIGFLEQIQTAAPDCVWLYGAPLGELYAKSGRDIEPLCALMEKTNVQDDTPALLRAITLRRQKDYDGAIALCQERVNAGSSMAYEMYRQQSLCYLLTERYAEAYTAANKAYQSSSPSIQLCNTVALAALAAGESAAYDEVKSLLEGSGYTLSEEVTGYRDGTISIENILLEGDYDIT